MKIAVVSNMYPDKKHPYYGVFVKNFCRILKKLDQRVDLCVMKKPDNAVEKALYYVSFYLGSTVKLLVSRYDLWYVHYASHSSLPVLIARHLRKTPIYTNVHGSDVFPENARQEKMQKYTKRILSHSDKVIVPSPYFAKVVENKYGISPEKIAVSPSGGVSRTLFYPKEKIQKDVLTLGFVGRISAGKGWDTALLACSKLTIPFELIMTGDGPEAGEMKQMAEELGLLGHIRFTGMCDQETLAKLYQSFDVLLFPTRREGESLGLVAIEAMACGTPVIASDFAAPADYVKCGVNGYTFPVADANALSRRIEEFASLSADERRLLYKGALRTASAYSFNRLTDGMKRILEIQE